LKANYTMSLVREPHHIALFNTEKVKEESFENGPLRVDHFATSVKMSTYLVAFVVCDFANNTKLTKSGTRVCTLMFAFFTLVLLPVINLLLTFHTKDVLFMWSCYHKLQSHYITCIQQFTRLCFWIFNS